MTTPRCATSGDNDTPQPAYYYYKTGGTVPITSLQLPALPRRRCGRDGCRPPTAAPGQRVVVGATSGVGGSDERANFAIWYSYYRTRLLLIKSAASLAFTPLTDSFRVGFITVQAEGQPDRRGRSIRPSTSPSTTSPRPSAGSGSTSCSRRSRRLVADP